MGILGESHPNSSDHIGHKKVLEQIIDVLKEEIKESGIRPVMSLEEILNKLFGLATKANLDEIRSRILSDN